MVHVRIDGSDAGRAAAKIEQTIARLPGEASRVVRGHGLQMEAEAKQNIVAMGAVDTGYMLGSVGIIEQSALSVTVAVGAEEYPFYVEYGASEMEARPFWRRARETVGPQFRDAAKKLLKDLLT